MSQNIDNLQGQLSGIKNNFVVYISLFKKILYLVILNCMYKLFTGTYLNTWQKVEISDRVENVDDAISSWGYDRPHAALHAGQSSTMALSKNLYFIVL